MVFARIGSETQEELIGRMQSFLDSFSLSTSTENFDVDTLFQGTPEGDFTTKQEEAGDWHAIYDSSEYSWHKEAYAMNVGRKDGNRWVEIVSVDTDGEWECIERLDESDPDNVWNALALTASKYLSGEEYFCSWAEYWIFCADSESDPLSECLNEDFEQKIASGEWVDFCINSAIEFINHLLPKERTEPPVFRCTRNALYRANTPGFEDKTVRQGHYVYTASTEEEALAEMHKRFPQDGEAGFTIDKWFNGSSSSEAGK